MKLTWLGHSAFRIDVNDSVILIDPFIKGCGHSEAQFDEYISGTTHVALTHGHGDHLGDTVEIAKSTGAKVIANADLCNWLGARHGVENLDRGNTGGTIAHDDFSVTFVDAKHSSAFVTDDGISHGLGHSNGLMFHFRDAPSLLHMGDTDIFSDMALIEELHQPDIGIVPIGDRFTMGSAVAALACQRYFNFSEIIPCHYGTFPALMPTADQFVEAMGEDRDKVKALSVGETLIV